MQTNLDLLMLLQAASNEARLIVTGIMPNYVQKRSLINTILFNPSPLQAMMRLYLATTSKLCTKVYTNSASCLCIVMDLGGPGFPELNFQMRTCGISGT